MGKPDLGRARWALSGGLTAMVLLAGCAAVSPVALPKEAPAAVVTELPECGYSETPDLERTIELTQGWLGTYDAISWARTFRDFLPNQLFTIDDKVPAPLDNTLVIGCVTEVIELGVDPQAPLTEELPFGSGSSRWGTLALTMTVTESFTGDSVPGEAFTFARTIYPRSAEDRAALRAAYAGQRVIVIADAPPEFAPYSGEYPTVGQLGGYIGFVDDEDRIHFPALEFGDADFLDGIGTLDDLRDAASVDRPVIRVVNGIRVE